MSHPKLTLSRETLCMLKVKTEIRAGVPKLSVRSQQWAGHSVVVYCPHTTAPAAPK